MNTITFMLALSLALTTVLIMLNFWLAQITPDSEKFSSVAILFLLFDLEIALLIPLPWAMQLQSPTTTLTWTFAITLLLTLGLIYEWTQGGLESAE